jgi:hypothetical protein
MEGTHMSFDDLVAKYKQRFPRQGGFELRPGERVRKASIGVPEKPSVYLIYGRRASNLSVLYTGKVGTLCQDGKFKDQGLLGRLNNRQRWTTRQAFVEQEMAKYGWESLVFSWFVTFDASVCVIPAKAEADLLQAYFDENGCLPEWNQSI